MRKFLAVLLSTLLLLATTQMVSAKHRSKKARGGNPTVVASLAKNKLSVLASFSNLGNVKAVSYELTYNSAKGPQGAGGTIKTGKQKRASRKLLLGTCSGKVCTYHKGARNIKLAVDFTLKSGGVVSYEKTVR